MLGHRVGRVRREGIVSGLDGSITVFLRRFGTFLRSELKFAKQ